MTGRFVDHGVCTLAAVGLLMAVMSSPIRPPVCQIVSPPNFLPRNFATLKFGYSDQFTISGRPSVREAEYFQSDIEDELDADIEDELTEASPPASVYFDLLPSPYPEPHSKLVSFAVTLTTRPLRC